MSELPDPIRAQRTTGGILMMLAPIVAIPLLFVAYGVLFSRGMEGIDASGPTVQATYKGCQEAGPVVLARVESMGLPNAKIEPNADGFVLTSVMPSREDVAERTPTDLVRGGHFEVRGGPTQDDELLLDNTEVTRASPFIGLVPVPRLLIQYEPELKQRLQVWRRDHSKGVMSLWLDGEKIHEQDNIHGGDSNELEVMFDDQDEAYNLDFAALSSILISHPLPCELELVGVQPTP